MKRPTDAQLNKLLCLVAEVIVTTPRERTLKPYQKTCFVDRDIIRGMRGLMSALGFDEEATRQRLAEIKHNQELLK